MELEKILIVGAGNGGQAAAVDLTLRGFDVCLYEFPEFSDKLKDKIASQKIPSIGFIERETKIDLITTDEQEAINYSRIVLVTMPAFGHPKVITTFRKKLKEGSHVYFFPGNLSTLTNHNVKEFSQRNITLVEFNSLPYGCRVNEEGIVNISIETGLLTYASFPAKDTSKVIDEVEQLYNRNRQNTDVLEVSLNNPNPLIHPPGVLLNLGRIEKSAGEFYMYNEGMTDSVIRLIRGIDRERLQIGGELGYDLIPLEGFKGKLPNGSENSFIACGEYAKMRGPSHRDNRYLTEDVPFGLVYWSELGRKINVPTPVMDGLINITSAVLDTHFDTRRTTLASLPNNPRKIRDLLYEGF